MDSAWKKSTQEFKQEPVRPEGLTNVPKWTLELVFWLTNPHSQENSLCSWHHQFLAYQQHLSFASLIKESLGSPPPKLSSCRRPEYREAGTILSVDNLVLKRSLVCRSKRSFSIVIFSVNSSWSSILKVLFLVECFSLEQNDLIGSFQPKQFHDSMIPWNK